MKRWVAVFDTHGDMIDPEADAAFRRFVDLFRPDIRIHGGDAFDFRSLRSKATEEERQESMKADVDAGIAFLSWFQPDAWLIGNHDHRLIRTAESAMNGNLRSYAALLLDSITDSLPGTKIIPWGKRAGVYTLGDLNIIHGYHAGLYAARQAASIYGKVLMGHIHARSEFELPRWNGDEIGYSCGGLCRLDMDYNAGTPNTLRQSHGWAYGVLADHGHTVVHLARQTSGRWIVPMDFAVMEAAHEPV